MEGEDINVTEVASQQVGDTPVESQSEITSPDVENGSILGKEDNLDNAGSILGKDNTGEPENTEQVETPASEIEYEDFILPEGMTANSEMMAEAKGAFKELGLSQEQSQKLVDMNSNAINEALAAKDQEWLDTTEKWAKEVSADPELGGRNYKNSIAMANRTLAKFDHSGELTEFLTTTQAGNNPAMIHFLINIDRAMGEDSFERGGSASKSREISDAEAFYPEQYKREQLYKSF